MKKNSIQKIYLAISLTFASFSFVTPSIVYADEQVSDYTGDVFLEQDVYTYDGSEKEAVVQSVNAFSRNDQYKEKSVYRAVNALTVNEPAGLYLVMDSTTIGGAISAGDYTFSVSGVLYRRTQGEGGFVDTPLGTFQSSVLMRINEAEPEPEPEQITISSNDVTLTNSLTYNGKEQTQTISVVVNGNTLTEGTDYTVSGNKATEVGVHALTVTGIGNYTGTVKIEYSIAKAETKKTSIANATVTLTNSLTYTGKEQTQNVEVSLDGKILTEGTDYTVSGNKGTKAGNYTLTVKGTGNYTGKVKKTYSIAKAKSTKKTMSDATITLVNTLKYNGKEQTQQIKVKIDNTTLKENVDYTVTGNKATKAGVYTLTVTGKGSYSGSIKKGYTISENKDKTDISKATITLSNTLTYTGDKQTQEVTVKLDGTTLKEGTDYTISGNTATEAGDYTLTVTGKGTYEGTATKSYTIAKGEEKTSSVPYIIGGILVVTVVVAAIGAVIYFRKQQEE